MIKREYISERSWVDLDRAIANETTITKWWLFGLILLRTRIVRVENTIVDGGKKLGFSK